MKPADSDPALSSSETPETDRALQWLKTSHAQSDLLTAVSAKIRARTRWRRSLCAASGIGAVMIAVALWVQLPSTTDSFSEPQKRTATFTAPQHQLLPDGSVVELNAGAEVAHAFTESVRQVTLIRGEAHFRVAKNPLRPFVVNAGGVLVRAVGTAFSVNVDAGGVEVLVTEGKVAVEKNDASALGNSPPLLPAAPNSTLVPLLSAGGRALIPSREAPLEVGTLPVAELNKRLAWRVPQLEFSRTPLAEVVELVNTHSGKALQLSLDPASPELADIQLSGFLGADNIDGLIRLLQTNFAVQADITGEAIILRKRR
ncbi:MAG TPA: FecR domain-containing protein [Opitutaceae bacterium]|nr:FecR domain-containing protein [Opitutaceae bacterium]